MISRHWRGAALARSRDSRDLVTTSVSGVTPSAFMRDDSVEGASPAGAPRPPPRHLPVGALQRAHDVVALDAGQVLARSSAGPPVGGAGASARAAAAPDPG
jgi:hypothetical protein